MFIHCGKKNNPAIEKKKLRNINKLPTMSYFRRQRVQLINSFDSFVLHLCFFKNLLKLYFSNYLNAMKFIVCINGALN